MSITTRGTFYPSFVLACACALACGDDDAAETTPNTTPNPATSAPTAPEAAGADQGDAPEAGEPEVAELPAFTRLPEASPTSGDLQSRAPFLNRSGACTIADPASSVAHPRSSRRRPRGATSVTVTVDGGEPKEMLLPSDASDEIWEPTERRRHDIHRLRGLPGAEANAEGVAFRLMRACPGYSRPCVLFGPTADVASAESAPAPAWGAFFERTHFVPTGPETRSEPYLVHTGPPCRAMSFRRQAIPVPDGERAATVRGGLPDLTRVAATVTAPSSTATEWHFNARRAHYRLRRTDNRFPNVDLSIRGRLIFTEDSPLRREGREDYAIAFLAAHDRLDVMLVKAGSEIALVFPGGAATGHEVRLRAPYEASRGQVFVWGTDAKLAAPFDENLIPPEVPDLPEHRVSRMTECFPVHQEPLRREPMGDEERDFMGSLRGKVHVASLGLARVSATELRSLWWGGVDVYRRIGSRESDDFELRNCPDTDQACAYPSRRPEDWFLSTKNEVRVTLTSSRPENEALSTDTLKVYTRDVSPFAMGGNDYHEPTFGYSLGGPIAWFETPAVDARNVRLSHPGELREWARPQLFEAPSGGKLLIVSVLDRLRQSESGQPEMFAALFDESNVPTTVGQVAFNPDARGHVIVMVGEGCMNFAFVPGDRAIVHSSVKNQSITVVHDIESPGMGRALRQTADGWGAAPVIGD